MDVQGRPTAQRLTRSQQVKQATQEQTAEQGGSPGGPSSPAEEPEAMVKRWQSKTPCDVYGAGN